MKYLLVLLSLMFLISCNSEGTSSEETNPEGTNPEETSPEGTSPEETSPEEISSEGTSSEIENRINCGNYDLYEDVSEVLNYSFTGETTCLSGDCFDPADILLNFGYLDMRNSISDNHTGYYSLNSVFTMPNGDRFGISYGVIGYDDTISEMKIRLAADDTLCQAQYGVDAYDNAFSHIVLFNNNIPTFNSDCEEIIKGNYNEVQLCEGYVQGVDDFIIYISDGTFSLKRIDHINP